MNPVKILAIVVLCASAIVGTIALCSQRSPLEHSPRAVAATLASRIRRDAPRQIWGPGELAAGLDTGLWHIFSPGPGKSPLLATNGADVRLIHSAEDLAGCLASVREIREVETFWFLVRVHLLTIDLPEGHALLRVGEKASLCGAGPRCPGKTRLIEGRVEDVAEEDGGMAFTAVEEGTVWCVKYRLLLRPGQLVPRLKSR